MSELATHSKFRSRNGSPRENCTFTVVENVVFIVGSSILFAWNERLLDFFERL